MDDIERGIQTEDEDSDEGRWDIGGFGEVNFLTDMCFVGAASWGGAGGTSELNGQEMEVEGRLGRDLSIDNNSKDDWWWLVLTGRGSSDKMAEKSRIVDNNTPVRSQVDPIIVQSRWLVVTRQGGIPIEF